MQCFLDQIEAEEKNKYFWWLDFHVLAWDIDFVEQIPQQDDRTSSGLFMLKFLEHWNGQRLRKGFTQELIDQFRPKLAAILVNSDQNEENRIVGSPEI